MKMTNIDEVIERLQCAIDTDLYMLNESSNDISALIEAYQAAVARAEKAAAQCAEMRGLLEIYAENERRPSITHWDLSMKIKRILESTDAAP